jgi:hypothetical protein
MLWRNCLISLIIAGSTYGALLPTQFAGAAQTPLPAPVLSDRAVWEEYGLKASERSKYGAHTVTAYRFQDSTGAFASLLWLRGDNAVGGVLAQFDNYVLLIEGGKPSPEQIQGLGASLPQRRVASLPILTGYFPAEHRIHGSERYIAGPASLAKFEPRLPASIVGFEMGAEAEVARYRIGDNEEQVFLVSYPTPQIAMERSKAFKGIVGTLRRSGPMLITVPAPVDSAAAQSLVSRVSYAPNLMWHEKSPVDVRQVGDMILAISLLALGLMVGSVFVGFFLGGIRRLFGRVGFGGGDESLTELNLQQPQS